MDTLNKESGGRVSTYDNAPTPIPETALHNLRDNYETNVEELRTGYVGDVAECITSWFFTNFEDPAESTPYDSGEGGYQYIWGGPFDTREIIESALFRVIPEADLGEIIEAALQKIESDECVPLFGRYDPESGPQDEVF